MPGDRIPRIVLPPNGITRLPLTPTEGFVLSRIDGTLSEGDLELSTGLGSDQIQGVLAKLWQLGAVRFKGEADPPAAAKGPPAPEPRPLSTPAAPQSRPASPQSKPGILQPKPESPRTTSSAEAASALPADGIELEHAHRNRISETHAQLEKMNHYELLRIPFEADRKTIKKAYYELAGEFHPDRFFRKQLGPYKEKMEAIFTQLTQAHDALTSKARASYDSDLKARGFRTESPIKQTAVPASGPSADSFPPGQRSSHRPAAAAMVPPPPTNPGLRVPGAVKPSSPKSPITSPPSSPKSPITSPPSSPKSPITSPPSSPKSPITSPPTPRISSANVPAQAIPPRISTAPVRISENPAPRQSPIPPGPPSDPNLRREAFARRIKGGSVPPPASPAAVDGLKHRYESLKIQAARSQAKKKAELAEAALARGDLVRARAEANSALQLCPDDDTIRALVARVSNR